MLNVKALQGDTDVRTAVTRLTDEQLHEAEAAFRRLGDKPKLSLLAYLNFALANYKEPDQQKALAEAIAEYVATKREAHVRTLLSGRQLRSIENELEALKKIPKGPVSQFTPAVLVPHLERGKHSLKTYNNRRGRATMKSLRSC